LKQLIINNTLLVKAFFAKLKELIGWKIVDTYIITKFFSSFFLSISLLMSIIIVFDFSENVHRFLNNNITFFDIVFGYYLNFIPYFINLFIPLFAFISTIWFTSRLSNRNEIVAILNGGVSFYRLMVPYLVGALLVALLAVVMSNVIVPKTNANLNAFKNLYSKRNMIPKTSFHARTSANSYVYVRRWNGAEMLGSSFTYEIIGNKSLDYKLFANEIQYDQETEKWILYNYMYRKINNGEEEIYSGERLDTVFNFLPEDFSQNEYSCELLTYGELNKLINNEIERGTGMAKFFIIEKHKRLANSFGSVMMIILGLSVAAQKTRRGTGVHLFLGLGFAFTFIFFQQVSTVFSLYGSVPPALGPWIPNIIFFIVCIIMIRFTMK